MICEQKSPESNNLVSVDMCCDNHCDNQESLDLTNATDCDNNDISETVIVYMRPKEKTDTQNNHRCASIDYPIMQSLDTIDEPIFSNDDTNSKSDLLTAATNDNTVADYDMISIRSWDMDLSISGDEDVIEDDVDCGINHCESTSDKSTPANSPNFVCCSARASVKNMESLMFVRKVCLKRRNAVRHECKSLRKMPDWAIHRPNDKPCLHNKICPYPDCKDDAESDKGITIECFVDSPDHSIYATMNEFRKDDSYGDQPQFTAYSNPFNAAKNRYSDIFCIEDSRVKLIRDTITLTPTEDSLNMSSVTATDYIHANWVDGYRQKNAYICTQGPLSNTASDFWHMVMQYRSPIIVMTTRLREQNRDKCYEYWPETVGDTKLIVGVTDEFDSFEVVCLRSKEFGPNCPKNGVCEHTSDHWYRVSLLQVTNCRTEVVHRVNHFYFHSWPDQGIPHSTKAFLHFVLQIRRIYRLNIIKLDYESEMDQLIPPPPIVVHCSAGIGRTGTYVVTEICTKSLSDCGRFNLYQTMLKVRSQRYKCVQNCYQYIYCRNAIIDYARQINLLPKSIENMSENENEDDDKDDYDAACDNDEEDYQEHDDDDFEEEIYEEQEVDEAVEHEHGHDENSENNDENEIVTEVHVDTNIGDVLKAI